jgi:hypothetical protein
LFSIKEIGSLFLLISSAPSPSSLHHEESHVT